MKYYELSKEEKQILKAYESGKYRSLGRGEIARYQKYAKFTLDKTKNINIRISERDVRKIKALAMRKGIPYQTLISSIIHQYGEE